MRHKILAAFGAVTLAGAAVLAAGLPASASSSVVTAYVINGTDSGDGTMDGYASNNQPESLISDYYSYEDLAVGIWNSDPQGAETWGGDAVNLVEAASCPAKGDYCIYISQADLTSLNECAYGSVYAAGGLEPGDGKRGYIVLGTNCSSYPQEERITIITHEFGHALGIPYDGSTDTTDLMSDAVFPSVQTPDYAQYQDVGVWQATGVQSNAH